VVHAEQAKLAREITAAQRSADASQLEMLQKRQAELQQQEDELRARMGDPLIGVEAPADAVQVIAILPGGEIKRLIYDPASRKWLLRFDIPTYAREGEYVITVIEVLKNGARKTVTINYHVDLTPPAGVARAHVVAGQRPALRLQLSASEDTARVKALLPWGEIVEMQPSAHPHRFFALVPISRAAQNARPAVQFILTDKAHNRTTIWVDMEAE
jgi:hypothetical protein